MNENEDTNSVTQEKVKEAFGAAAPFPVEQHSHEGRDHFIDRLISVFHDAQGLDDRHRAVGLLNSLSQACGMAAGVMTGEYKVEKFVTNPMWGIFYQFEELRKLFPVDQANVLVQRDNMLDMYFFTDAVAQQAVAKYANEGVIVEALYATTLDDKARYVLRLLEHHVPEGQKSALTIGQLMWFHDKDAVPADLVEADWNPYYVTPVAANDPAPTNPSLPEGFGDQEFVGAGSVPVIVGASFEEAERGESDESGLELEDDGDDLPL